MTPTPSIVNENFFRQVPSDPWHMSSYFWPFFGCLLVNFPCEKSIFPYFSSPRGVATSVSFPEARNWKETESGLHREGYYKLNASSFTTFIVVCKHIIGTDYIQLGSSSRAKHGGAYFSAVFGRKFNPTTVLRPSQPLACYWRVIFPALCHFSFVFEKYTVLKAAFQEDFFKNVPLCLPAFRLSAIGWYKGS